MIAAGFPTIYQDRGYLKDCTVPRIFVQSTHDQFGPVDQIRPFVESLPEPKRLILIEAQDHFFAERFGSLWKQEIAGLDAR